MGYLFFEVERIFRVRGINNYLVNALPALNGVQKIEKAAFLTEVCLFQAQESPEFPSCLEQAYGYLRCYRLRNMMRLDYNVEFQMLNFMK